MKTILSGIKNTGVPHLGNYLGMLKPMGDLQREKVLSGEFCLNAFIPDLHALNSDPDYKKMVAQTIFNVKCYIAAGLDAKDLNTLVYRQSRVPAHSELAIVLHNFVGMGELARQTQYKEKVGRGDESVSVGLFYYPILMAADILLYGAEFVPVGEDQRQHVELARDLAIRFNNKFGDVFTVPASMKDQVRFAGEEEPIRIMSLSDPNKKMSKSVSDPRGTIDLTDMPEIARKKIMGATTDSVELIQVDKLDQPGITNLLNIQALMEGRKLAEVADDYLGITQYGPLKTKVADLVCDFLERFQAKLAEISDQQVLVLLESCEERARETSSALLKLAQEAVGL
jgi:tryptophanyl-tRNA synthetase